MKLLQELLSTTTPAGYETPVSDIIKREVGSSANITEDALKNLVIRVGVSKTLFLSHMDSVHNHEKVVLHTDNQGIISLGEGCAQRALGADDKAGVRVMLHLIKQGVAGVYAFCVQEEVGCIGSGFLAETLDMTGIKQAISFDRKGTASIITAMAAGNCASDSFTSSLSRELGKTSTHVWEADPTGSVTDSMSFSNKVINYTNISVGYYNEHSKRETLDSTYLLEVLLPAATGVRWEELSEVAPTQEVYGIASLEPEDTIEALWDYFSYNPQDTFTGEEVMDIMLSLEGGGTPTGQDGAHEGFYSDDLAQVRG